MRRDMTGEEFVALFKEDLCLFDLRSRNKEEVLRELVERLHMTGKVSNKKIVLEMLFRRESLGSTALGHGIAIPHGRTLMARKLMIAFGRCQEGLDFEAPDGKPVHLFFLIIAPYKDRSNQYLPALGKIAEFFRKKGLRESILRVSNFKDFIDVLSAEAKFS
jgi:PTS system nitrogen regulatory IIA component